MKVGKGIVKKYSREYNRTLKNGEKRKYTTEQIQITVPKTEDIYENKEEVLIIPHSEIEDFNQIHETNESLKIANYLTLEKVKELEKQLENSNKPSASEYEKEIKRLKQEIDDMNKNNIENLKKENDTIKNKHSKLIEENENLKHKFINIKTEVENLKTKYSSIKEENENLKNKQSNIKTEHDHLKKKYCDMKEENKSLKNEYSS